MAQQQINEPVSPDKGMHSLPNELLKCILDAVPLHEKPGLAAVSTRWRNIIQEDGIFRLQLMVPRLLLKAWLGSADDDPSRGGLHLDLSRPVRLSLAINDPLNVATSQAATTGDTASTNLRGFTIVWARVVPHNTARLAELVESEGRGGAAPLTLVGRLPHLTSLSAWSVTSSSAGSGTMTLSLDKLVTGLGLGMLPKLEHLHANQCTHLSWVTLPPNVRVLELSDCIELKFLQASVTSRAPPLQKLLRLHLSRYFAIDPACLLALFPTTASPAASCPPLLERLDLSWLRHVPQDIICKILERCAGLHTVLLQGVAGPDVMSALRGFSCLKIVELDSNGDVVPADVWALLELNPHIFRLTVRRCKAIDDEQRSRIARHVEERVRAARDQRTLEDVVSMIATAFREKSAALS